MDQRVTWRLGSGKGKLESHSENGGELKCSFCDKSQAEVAKLFANPSGRASRAYICNECIEVCNLILEEDSK